MKENRFKIGDYIIMTIENKIFLYDGEYNGGYGEIEYWDMLDGYILWTPKEGEVVVCWDNIDPRLKEISTVYNCEVHGLMVNDTEIYLYDKIIPYTNQDFKDMK